MEIDDIAYELYKLTNQKHIEKWGFLIRKSHPKLLKYFIEAELILRQLKIEKIKKRCLK